VQDEHGNVTKVKVPIGQSANLKVYDLISLEEAVFDEGGYWVYFN